MGRNKKKGGSSDGGQPQGSGAQQRPKTEPLQSQNQLEASGSRPIPQQMHKKKIIETNRTVLKPGEWNCSKCNVINFTKRVDCFRCHEPKPVESTKQQKPLSNPQTSGRPQSSGFGFVSSADTKQDQPKLSPWGAPPAFSSSKTVFSSEQQLKQSIRQPQAMEDTSSIKAQSSSSNSQSLKSQQSKTEPSSFPQSSSSSERPRGKKKQSEQRPLSNINSSKQRLQMETSQVASSSPLSQKKLTSNVQKMSLSPKKQPCSSILIESSPDGRVYEGTKGQRCKVEVNYATILLKSLPMEVFHYDVTFDPDTPKKMLPSAINAFMHTFFPQYPPAFDGRKNLITSRRLEINGQRIGQDGFTEDIEAHLGDRSRRFKITVKYAASIDWSVLLNYRDSIFQNEDKPSIAIQALDIVMRSAFQENIDKNEAIQAGRGLYFHPGSNSRQDLGDGMELWYGLFLSAILGRSKIYLNTDILHKAFPCAIPILEFLKYSTRDQRVPEELDRRQESQLKDYLSMLTVRYRTNSNEPYRTYGFNGLDKPASIARFESNGQIMTVQNYYATQKGIRLRYPKLPLLWVGSKNKKILLPIEFVEISPGQATNKKCTPNCVASIIKYSATSTDERKRKIQNLLNKISFNTNPTIAGFGIEVDKKFNSVDARVIDPPKLTYKNSDVWPKNGVWREDKFIATLPGQIKWTIINCDDRTRIDAIMDLKKNICFEAKKQNINLMDVSVNEIINVNFFRDARKIESELDNCLQKGYRFVLVIVIDQNDCYAHVKQAAELKVGILTQCIKANTIFRMGRGNPTMTIKNILLKLNAKLGGKNHQINEESYIKFNQNDSSVMFVGADVTHPSPDQRNIPSVVGVASSHDIVGFKYCCAWRLQDPKREMIEDLENILVEHLAFYRSKNGNRLPAKIMYYRDGVSDGQFKAVLDIEMTAIRRAMMRIYGPEINKHAKITFIVVQKRHHTRFFPLDRKFSEGRNNNILPGTVVDKDIVHPFQYQFFMASHAAIQGVTKPTKYCILINESQIIPDDIQAITYDLCHLFTRCNRSVSYPAPTYYAHLVAARGKNYIIGKQLNMMNLKRECENRSIRPAISENSPMFFV